MKVTYNDLKTAYRSHIRSHIPPSREGCPSKENILGVFEKSMPAKKKEEVIDHVVKCAYCLQEFELLLNLAREENWAVREISNLLEEKVQDARLLGKKPKIWNIIFGSSAQHHRLWRLAAVSLVLLIMTGFFLISIKSTFKPALDEERGKLGDQVRLISPIQGRTGTFPLVFRWQKVQGAKLYQLEIFDGALLPLWKSPQIVDSFYRLTPEVAELIEKNKVYFWMVAAFLPNGGKKESPLERFILTR
jgi:hypothetical protein